MVNPSKIRSVPLYDSNKMRVSEMFIACKLEIQDGKYMDENLDIVRFDEEYHKYSVEELISSINNNNFQAIECQGNKSFNDKKEVENILDTIKQVLNKRIVNI